MVRLLIFGSYKQRSRSNKLQLLLPDTLHREVSIDDARNNKQGLWEHFELEVHIQQPVQQNCSHGTSYLALPDVPTHLGLRCLLLQHAAHGLVEVVGELEVQVAIRARLFLLDLWLAADSGGVLRVQGLTSLLRKGSVLVVVEAYAAEMGFVVWLVELRQLGQVADLSSEESVQRLHYTYYITVTNELHS